MSQCKCEFFTDKERIKCLVGAFNRLMVARGMGLSQQQIQNMLENNRLKDIQLFQLEAKSETHALTESQILHSFVREFIKTHPRFAIDGPDLGDLVLKTNFLQGI